jgi:hypothetical protein
MMMDGSGKERPGAIAKCIYALIIALGIAIIILAIIALRSQPGSVPDSQLLPGQVAGKLGQSPNAGPPQ